MDTLPHDVIVKEILTRAPQLGLASKKFYGLLPKISPEQKCNIQFPSSQNRNPVQIKNGNLSFEYEAKINFSELDKLIEDEKVQRLSISNRSPIFIEIKRIFEIILKNPVSVMNGWKYRQTFIQVDKTHYDAHKCRKPTFVHFNWMDSFVMSFIFYLYH
jgi:hypothetical protein